MTGLLYEDLTYQIRGILFSIRREYGPGQKEIIYHRLLLEKLTLANLPAVSEPKIIISSHDTGKVIGVYQPDIVVDNKIIIEIKSSTIAPVLDEKQLYYYLRNSSYEVGILVNFSTPKLFIKRMIYTNDRKNLH